MVNITDDLKCPLLWIGFGNVLLNPCYKMILEYTLDQLVEDVRCHEFMDVGTGEVMCKWLDVLNSQLAYVQEKNETYSNINADAILIPDGTRIPLCDNEVRLFMCS